MKPMREVRKGDKALVIPDPNGDPSLRHLDGTIVTVTSDPHFCAMYGRGGRPFAGIHNDILDPRNPNEWIGHPTHLLIPIDPDDDTRQQFEAEVQSCTSA